MTAIDFHNHFYPQAYIDALRSGSSRVRVTIDNDGNPVLHYPGDYNIAGSDYPHQIGSLRRMLDSINALNISDSDRAAILGGNAARLLRLD